MDRGILSGMSLPAAVHPAAVPDVLTERQEEVAALRVHGFTLREIAKKVGVSHTTVKDDLKKIRAVWRQNMAQSYDDHVAQQLAKYEELAKALQPQIKRGDWKAIDTAIRLADRHSRLLGLDQPVRHDVHVSIEAIDDEIARLEAKSGGLPVLEGEVVSDTPDSSSGV